MMLCSLLEVVDDDDDFLARDFLMTCYLFANKYGLYPPLISYSLIFLRRALAPTDHDQEERMLRGREGPCSDDCREGWLSSSCSS